MAKERNLPPFEEEVVGKTRQQLQSLREDYIKRAHKLFFEGQSWEEQMVDSFTLAIRANSIGFIEDYLKVQEIVTDPNATPEDKRFATEFIWFVKVTKTYYGRLRTPPWERAEIIINPRKLKTREPSREEIAEYNTWFHENADKVLQQVLDEMPHPEGTIKTVTEFHEKYSVENESIET